MSERSSDIYPFLVGLSIGGLLGPIGGAFIQSQSEPKRMNQAIGRTLTDIQSSPDPQEALAKAIKEYSERNGSDSIPPRGKNVIPAPAQPTATP